MVSKKHDLIDRLIERDRVSPRFSSFARGVTRFRRIGNFAFQPERVIGPPSCDTAQLGFQT